MSTEREQLKNRLGELHEQLTHGGEVDPETRELLVQLAADIDSLLVRSRAGAEEDLPDEGEKQSLVDRMMDMTSEFEESHPTLATTIGRIADALSNIGI